MVARLSLPIAAALVAVRVTALVIAAAKRATFPASNVPPRTVTTTNQRKEQCD
jgi:hypothetical protein